MLTQGFEKTSTQTVCKEGFFIVGETADGSAMWTQRIEKTSTPAVCEEIFFIIEGPADGSAMWTTKNQGELLHRRRSGAEVFYIHRFQVVEILVISNSSRCNLGLFQFEIHSVGGVLNTRSPVRVNCKFGPEAAYEDSEGQQRRIQRKTCFGGKQQKYQLLEGGRSRRGASSKGSATE